MRAHRARPVASPRRTLDDLGRDFLDSPFGAGDLGSVSARLACFLAAARFDRVAADRDAFDLLLNRVSELRAGRHPRPSTGAHGPVITA